MDVTGGPCDTLRRISNSLSSQTNVILAKPSTSIGEFARHNASIVPFLDLGVGVNAQNSLATANHVRTSGQPQTFREKLGNGTKKPVVVADRLRGPYRQTARADPPLYPHSPITM